jgi:hypothetical protein
MLHLMPVKYSPKDLGKLISAIWSKYLDLQGGDVETQKQLLSKEKEIFQKEKEIQDLKLKLQDSKSKNTDNAINAEFEGYLTSGKVDSFLALKKEFLTNPVLETNKVGNAAETIAFDLVALHSNKQYVTLTAKGKEFYK